MAWQRYIMLRRARLQALEDVIKELTLKGQQPKLWDIRVSSEGERSYNWNNIFASDFLLTANQHLSLTCVVCL